MDNQEAAQILTELAMFEEDLELMDALILGAQILREDELKWVPEELRGWLIC